LKCNIDNHEWYVSYIKFKIGRGCKKCTGTLKLTQEEANLHILNICKEKDYTLLEPIIYKNDRTKIHLKCNKDDYDWEVTFNKINQNRGCPKCGGKLKITQEVAEQNVIKKCKELNYIILKPFIYKNNKTKIHLKCLNDGNEWFVCYSNLIHNNRKCSNCNFSKGERTIENFLKENIIKYETQKRFKDYKYTLPFDFYLPEYNLCIEYDGELHFISTEYFGGKEKLKEQQIRDEIKTQYCLNNNINLLRIIYKEFKKISEILKKYLNI
jgi:very-short-patch-repair endonuclease